MTHPQRISCPFPTKVPCLLVRHVLSHLPGEVPAARAIDDESLRALQACAFPGNVRELKSTVERLAMLAEGPSITVADLAFERVLQTERDRSDPRALDAGYSRSAPPPAPLGLFKDAKRVLIEEFERDYLRRLLDRAGDNLTQAAALAGLARNNLRDLLKKHGLYARE